ncbi:MAG: 2-C-methyl-D-erythritol 4-phosphate cytidylyltransferase [Syntrophotalea sp.]|uniref:2-C-methyl-D-erythritol 4-phosphate cytidylyltransferase n=2 Tax=Syntrophotalea TaxID=2812025 RepID=UPI003D1091E6
MSVFVLLPAAGMGKRMGASVNKQYLPLGERPVLSHTIALFDRHPRVDHIFVICPQAEMPLCQQQVIDPYGFSKVRGLVPGGAERQDSVRNGLLACGAAPDDVVLIHDGARPLLPFELIDAAIEKAEKSGAAIVGVPVKDTIKLVRDGMIEATPDRRHLWQAQTPQGFRFGAILDAHRLAQQQNYQGTDDASLIEWTGGRVAVIPGSYRNIKITTPEDLLLARAFLDNPGYPGMMRIGHGYDVHQLVAERKLILGGVEIAYHLGLLGHSDADVLLHAICDAILGALGEGDIGKHFPDTDPAYRGISSIKLLREVMRLTRDKGYALGNLDATIIAQRPKLAPFIARMRERIADACGTDCDRINVKATTTEQLGFEGRGEGISSHAVVVLSKVAGNH